MRVAEGFSPRRYSLPPVVGAGGIRARWDAALDARLDKLNSSDGAGNANVNGCVDLATSEGVEEGGGGKRPTPKKSK